MRSFKRGSRGYNMNYTYSSVTSRKTRGKIVWLLVLLLIAIFITLFAYTLFSGKSPFAGFKVSYDDSLSGEERAFLESVLENNPDLKLSSNITISASDASEVPEGENIVVYDALVPTAEFYDTRSGVSSAEVAGVSDVEYVSIRELTPERKVLSLDGNYYLDDFKHGAKFRILTLESAKTPTEEVATLTARLNLPTSENVLSINQTGVTALTRGMIDELNQQKAQGGDATYFSREVRDFLAKTDFTHLSNEVSFAEDCSVSSTSVTLCSPTEMIEVVKDVGADVIELTGNHNNDYGTEANLETIETYAKLGLSTFGGGKDAEAAKVPLTLNSKNSHVTLLGYNYSTSTVANGQGASENLPGANIYDEETAAADIMTAKQNGDIVIADVQYFECYSYPNEGEEYPECDYPISGQEEFFRHLIDLGADIVVGTQAHQPQTYELYNGKPIYYGLGNLFFDQIYWPGTTRGYILTHYFYNNKYLQTRITPHQYDSHYQTKLMDEETAQWFLNRLGAARSAE